jgi:hypothetical protein
MGWEPMLGELQRWAVRNGIDKSGINKLGWNVLSSTISAKLRILAGFLFTTHVVSF